MSSSNNDNRKSKRGRPRTGVGKLIGLRWSDAELKEIDNWRREEQDLPTRPDALRRLVKMGLTVKRSKGK